MDASAVLYIPLELTHLHGSAIHQRLDPRQRLRYNQLCGLMAAEQFLAFEETVIIRAVRRLAATAAVRADAGLAQALDGMLAEEAVHARWFARLLAEVEPGLYAAGGPCFTRLRWYERLALLPLAYTRDGALLMLWFTLLIEEHSLQLSQAMLDADAGRAAGAAPLDPRFLAVHQRHLVDELRHLPLNLRLIACCFDPLPAWRRRLLAWVFRRLLREIARPRRANAAVVRRLVAEFPALTPHQDTLLRTVRDDFRDHAPRSDVTHPHFHPHTLEALRARPEFAGVVADMEAGWKAPRRDLGVRLALLVALEVAASTAYFAVAAAARALVPHPAGVPVTALDLWLPQVPALVLAYHSFGLFVLGAAWCTTDGFRRVLRAGGLATLVAYVCFLLLPLEQARGPLPAGEPWRTLSAHLHALDTPLNTMPSLHVAYVVLVLLARAPTPGRWWMLGWGLAIIASTVLTGQHVVLDVAAGAVLGGACWWWAGRR